MSDTSAEYKSAIDRRHLILGGVFCLAAGVAYTRTPHANMPLVDKDVFEKLVPEKIGPWGFETSSGVVLPPPDAMSDRLYDNLITRVYSANTEPPVMFLTAYSNTQDGTLQVHRPEICYPAGGYKLSETRSIKINNGLGGVIPANIFTAAGPDRTEHVLYWTRIGDQFPLVWRDQRLAVIKANLRGSIPDGVLVRMSVVMPDMQEALPVLQTFAADLNRSMNRRGRLLLSGITG